MNPRIPNPLGSAPQLPLMHTIHDAARLNEQHHTTFFVSAYLFQVWLCELTLANAAQLAEKPNPNDRSFQTGQAWQGFLKFFGKASDAEFPAIFCHLMQFSKYDDPMAAHLLHAAIPLSIEHALTREFLGKHTPAALAQHRQHRQKFLRLLRATTLRLCDWLDSVLHFRALQEWHLCPDCFDPDPQKRELTYLAITQRYFPSLDPRAQAHWRDHIAETIQELPNSPKWTTFLHAVSAPAPKPRPWPSFELDRAIIKLWPLLTHHSWSAHDLLCLLRRVLSPGDLAPCPDSTALIAHCARALGLRRPSLHSSRSHGSETPAVQVALRLCAPDPTPQPPPASSP